MTVTDTLAKDSGSVVDCNEDASEQVPMFAKETVRTTDELLKTVVAADEAPKTVEWKPVVITDWREASIFIVFGVADTINVLFREESMGDVCKLGTATSP